MKIFCLIPARGGSKGVPRKNIRPLAGKPLIAWTIEAAQKSRWITDIYVSTEDLEIASVSRNFGAKVIERPTEIADDQASLDEVIWDAKTQIKDFAEYDLLVVLQCTAPLRDEEHINEAIELFVKNQDRFDSARSVYIETYSPYWLTTMKDDGRLQALFTPPNGKGLTRRQDSPIVYRGNGAIRICKRDVFMDRKSISAGRAMPYIMGKAVSIDIDTEDDFYIAECLMEKKIKYL